MGGMIAMAIFALVVYIGFGYAMAYVENYQIQHHIQTAILASNKGRNEELLRRNLEAGLMTHKPPFTMKDVKITITPDNATVEVKYKVEFYYPLFEKPHTLHFHPKITVLATN